MLKWNFRVEEYWMLELSHKEEKGESMNYFIDSLSSSCIIVADDDILSVLLVFLKERLNLGIYDGICGKKEEWLLIEMDDLEFVDHSSLKFIILYPMHSLHSLHGLSSLENISKIRIVTEIPAVNVVNVDNTQRNNDLTGILKELKEWEPDVDHEEQYRKKLGIMAKVEMIMGELGYWCARQMVLDYCWFRVSRFNVQNYDSSKFVDEHMFSPLMLEIVKNIRLHTVVIMEKNSSVKMTARLLTSLQKFKKIGYFCGNSSNLNGDLRDLWDQVDVLVITSGCFKKIDLEFCKYAVVVDNCSSLQELLKLQKLTWRHITFIITRNEHRFLYKISKLKPEIMEDVEFQEVYFEPDRLKEMRDLVNIKSSIQNPGVDRLMLQDVFHKLNSGKIDVQYSKFMIDSIDWNGYKASCSFHYKGAITTLQTDLKVTMSVAKDALFYAIQDLIITFCDNGNSEKLIDFSFMSDAGFANKVPERLTFQNQASSDYLEAHVYLFIPGVQISGKGFGVFLNSHVNVPNIYILDQNMNWSSNISHLPISLTKGVIQIDNSQIEVIRNFQILICSDLLNNLKLDSESNSDLFCPVEFRVEGVTVDWNIDWEFMDKMKGPQKSLLEIPRKNLACPKFLSNLIVKSSHNQMIYRCLGIEKIITVASFSDDLGMTYEAFFKSQGYENLSNDTMIQARLISPLDTVIDEKLVSNALLLERSCFYQPYGWNWYVNFRLFTLAILAFEKHVSLSKFSDANLLDLQIHHLMEAFLAPAAQDIYSYERLEFIGDSVLKYLVTVDLWKIIPNDSISVARSLIVSNKNLCLAGQRLDLGNLVITYPLRDKYWTPPYFTSSHPSLHSVTSKMIADCFEAILGTIYIHYGIEKCRNFLLKIGLIQCAFFEQDIGLLNYSNLEASEIEKSLQYTFSNKNLLSAALGTDMSSNDDLILFNRLECLGDAALELVSTLFLFKSNHNCVGELNDQRQNLICNRNFSILAKKHGLTDSLSNFGSNIWEAVCGAILIDLYFNIVDFKEVILPHVVLSFTMNPKSCIRQLNEISQSDIFKDSDFDYRYSLSPETHIFTCHVWLDTLCIASGLGKCKSEAKRHACEAALSYFSVGSSFGCSL